MVLANSHLLNMCKIKGEGQPGGCLESRVNTKYKYDLMTDFISKIISETSFHCSANSHHH